MAVLQAIVQECLFPFTSNFYYVYIFIAQSNISCTLHWPLTYTGPVMIYIDEFNNCINSTKLLIKAHFAKWTLIELQWLHAYM